MGWNYGTTIRPGAPFAPFWVWQVLQSPLVWVAVIVRSTPPRTTFAWNGRVTAVVLEKLPTALTGNVKTRPVASVMTTWIPAPFTPLQSFGSRTVG
jgi:hypothetical protein